MPLLPVTTFTAAILGLLFLILSAWVIAGRFSHGVSLGDGGKEPMTVRIRIHANFAEQVPLILLLMALVERAHGLRFYLEIIAAILIVGRLIHPIGMMRPAPNIFRAGGMILTCIALGWLSVWALLIAIRMWSVIG